MSVGIVGYGSYVPRHRIKLEEIAKVWGADAPAYKRGLNLREKSVPAPDQDTITMSVEAARYAVRRAGVDPARIGAIYVGSESHPYAVKPSGTVVAEALGATPDIHCADFEFACKAGSEGMYVAMSLVKAGEMDYALGIGADTSQGAPGDALEYSASAAAPLPCTFCRTRRGRHPGGRRRACTRRPARDGPRGRPGPSAPRSRPRSPRRAPRRHRGANRTRRGRGHTAGMQPGAGGRERRDRESQTPSAAPPAAGARPRSRAS